MKHLPLIFALFMAAALVPTLIKAPQNLAETILQIGDYQ